MLIQRAEANAVDDLPEASGKTINIDCFAMQEKPQFDQKNRALAEKL